MATTSEINTKLAEVSASIVGARRLFNNGQDNIITSEAHLGAIQGNYTDLITTIQAFGDVDDHSIGASNRDGAETSGVDGLDVEIVRDDMHRCVLD